MARDLVALLALLPYIEPSLQIGTKNGNLAETVAMP